MAERPVIHYYYFRTEKFLRVELHDLSLITSKISYTSTYGCICYIEGGFLLIELLVLSVAVVVVVVADV